MKRIKPGRGPSKMSFAGSIFSVIFGIFWTVMAFGMTRGISEFGGPMSLVGIIFPLFGIGFVCMGIYQASIEYKNAHGSEEERMSYFDIVDTDESGSPREARAAHTAAHYCPACGEPLDADYAFCPNCGRELPR